MDVTTLRILFVAGVLAIAVIVGGLGALISWWLERRGEAAAAPAAGHLARGVPGLRARWGLPW